MRILIFGGLTAVGTSITNFFLQEGIETKVVKSTPFREAEEEQELFFGRNDLYRAIESGSDLEGDEAVETVCFAGHFDELTENTKSQLFKNLETVLERFHSVETVILLSHAVAEEAEKGERALPEEKELFREIEEGFTTHFENRDGAAKRRLFILRLPNLKSKEKELLSIDTYIEIVDINEIAKSIFKLTRLKIKKGVHTFRLVRDNEHGLRERGDDDPLALEEIHT
jgi:hypothetical protein